MTHFTSLLASQCATFRSRTALELENMALRHQITVLNRSARKRPKLIPLDRIEQWFAEIRKFNVRLPIVVIESARGQFKSGTLEQRAMV